MFISWMAVASTVAFMSAAPQRVAEPAYRPPVDAAVAEPFDMRRGRFGAGNRGLDYDVVPGTSVRAIAAGTVVFAGPVAGSAWVTVAHRSGLRSSYGPLARIDVARGEQLAAGQAVGTALGRLHLGVRDGDAYIDPATLFATRRPHARLVARQPPVRRDYTRRSA